MDRATFDSLLPFTSFYIQKRASVSDVFHGHSDGMWRDEGDDENSDLVEDNADHDSVMHKRLEQGA